MHLPPHDGTSPAGLTTPTRRAGGDARRLGPQGEET